jgi:hypothetical protein
MKIDIYLFRTAHLIPYFSLHRLIINSVLVIRTGLLIMSISGHLVQIYYLASR